MRCAQGLPVSTFEQEDAVKVVIPGGSGQVGTILARSFYADGHDVVVLSRRPILRPWRVLAWDGLNPGSWWRDIDGAEVVINLSGQSVNCRYTPENRAAILESRVQSTRAVGAAIAGAARPPRVWLQASTATIYAHRFDAANDERTGRLGGDEPGAPSTWNFSIGVARAWEAAFDACGTARTRKVLMRSAMTLSPDAGGVFDTLANLSRRGFGGRAGSGRQFMSWIHEHDFIAAVRWLIARDDMSGAVNLAAPSPLTNDEFMRELRDACGVPFGLPAGKWILELGAVFLRTETELILKSRRVVPGRLLESGFRFQFSEWRDAAQELCKRWKTERRPARVA